MLDPMDDHELRKDRLAICAFCTSRNAFFNPIILFSIREWFCGTYFCPVVTLSFPCVATEFWRLSRRRSFLLDWKIVRLPNFLVLFGALVWPKVLWVILANQSSYSLVRMKIQLIRLKGRRNHCHTHYKISNTTLLCRNTYWFCDVLCNTPIRQHVEEQ